MAADAFTKGKYALAAKKVEEGLAETAKRKSATLPLDGTEERDAKTVTGGIGAMAEIRLALAAKLERDRWSIDAEEMYVAMQSGFAGTAWEEKAKEALDRMAQDKRAQYEIAGMKKVREILSTLRPLTRKSLERAIAAFDDLLVLYEGSVTGDRAKAQQDRLKKLLEKP